MRGFKSWITERHPVAARLLQLERREIGEVGTGNSPSVSGPDIRASIDVVLNLNAWQETRLGLCPRYRHIRHKRGSSRIWIPRLRKSYHGPLNRHRLPPHTHPL